MTLTSNRSPSGAAGGMTAWTWTTAVFLSRMSCAGVTPASGPSARPTPSLSISCSMTARTLSGTSLEPVPLSPTTRPYPEQNTGSMPLSVAWAPIVSRRICGTSRVIGTSTARLGRPSLEHPVRAMMIGTIATPITTSQISPARNEPNPPSRRPKSLFTPPS